MIERKRKVTNFKEEIMEVLTGLEYGMKRTSKLGIEEFLILLAEFNKRGIHFR